MTLKERISDDMKTAMKAGEKERLGTIRLINAGYNVGGPEVEDCLLTHPAVAECGVIGKPDEARGMLIKAFVVLKPGHAGDAAMVKALQEHVKQTIAPYKYPREIEFMTALPRTETGKLQRFRLRQNT